jgi:hypothetical protein
MSITKRFLFGPAPQGCEISCDVNMTLSTPLSRTLCFGIESIINFLAPSELDRFFETPSGPRNLRFTGSVPGPILRLEDGWQRVRAALHAPVRMNSGLLRSRPFRNRKEVSNASTKVPKCSLFGVPTSPPKRPSQAACCGASNRSDRRKEKRHIGFQLAAKAQRLVSFGPQTSRPEADKCRAERCLLLDAQYLPQLRDRLF